eukprot:gene6382-7036_t
MIRARQAIRPVAKRVRLLSSHDKSTPPPVKPPQPPSSPYEKKKRSLVGEGLFLAFTGLGALSGYLAYMGDDVDPALKGVASLPFVASYVAPVREVFVQKGLVYKPAAAAVPPQALPPTELDAFVEHLDHEEQVDALAEGVPPEEERVVAKEEEEEVVQEEQVVEETQPAVEGVVAVEDAHVVNSVEVSEESPSAVVEEVVPQEEEKVVMVEEVKTLPPSLLPEVDAEVILQKRRGSSSSADLVADMARQTAVFRQQLQDSLLSDLHDLDAPALRARLTSLAGELFERLSWENVRLAGAVRAVEQQEEERYTHLLAQQRRELQIEIDRLLFEKEKAVVQEAAERVREAEDRAEARLQGALRAQGEGFRASLLASLADQQNALQAELNEKVALLRKSHNDHLLEMQPRLEELNGALLAAQQEVAEAVRVVKSAATNHKLSAAVLVLDSLLESGGGAGEGVQALQQLREVAEEEEVVRALLAALPADLLTKKHVPTLADLQVRFQVMRDEVRKVVLAPAGAPKLLGQIVGAVLAKLSFTPSGYLTGPGAEEALARAAFRLDHGDLAACVQELQGVEGYAQVLMSDWQQLARDRLLVDEARRILRANAVIRHKAYQQ